ncbi:hypothetical protein AXF42_Ash018224 [Apostasia shenzhenica]|uniref:Uncharacterized protein n=1 Tax=Apostasia shenzhenica TaxID=1088818 RepID=A0A2I0B1E0_9ASPA|nr:hypothetical protein AXF42_Ash018224 [Apostasia shenzhenica]
MYAKSQGYTIFKEITPPLGTVLMRRARRVQPPATQLSKQVVEEAGEEEVELPEPVCGGISIDVVSSPDNSGDDKKTLAEVMEEAGKGKEPASLARSKVIPKAAVGITIGRKGGREEAAEGGAGKEMAVVPCPGEEAVVAPSQALVSLETPKKKRGPPEENSLEPPVKKGKSDKEGGETDEEREWGKSVEPPLCRNFTGEFAGEGSKFVVSATEVKRKMIITSDQSSNLFNPVRGDLGLILAGGLATKALEETIERTSTTDLFAQMTNKVLARLPLILNRALRVEEQMIDQTGQLYRKDAEIEDLRLQLATESSKHAALREEYVVYKSAMSALKADNKALREKLSKADGDREAAVVSSSVAAVEAYKTSLPCRKERLDGIQRAWEGLASTLVQGGEVKAVVLGELDPFPCMAVDPIYKEEGFDLTDDTIQQFFDLLDGISEG